MFEYINGHYGLTIQRYDIVEYKGLRCRVTGTNSCSRFGGYYLTLRTMVANEKIQNVHPTWEMNYLAMGREEIDV